MNCTALARKLLTIVMLLNDVCFVLLSFVCTNCSN